MYNLKYPIFDGVNDEVIPPSKDKGGSVGHFAQTFNNLVDFMTPRLIYGINDFMGSEGETFRNSTAVYVIRMPVPLGYYFEDPTIEWELVQEREPVDFNYEYERDDLNLEPFSSPIFIGVTKGEKYSNDIVPVDFFQNIVTELTGSASYVQLPEINYNGLTWMNPVVVAPHHPFCKIKINLVETSTKPMPGLITQVGEFTSDTKRF